MTVNDSIARARAQALIDRITTNPDERCTDRDMAFALCVGRRWVIRVGADGPEAEFHTDRAGQRLGWRFTRRGIQVACEYLESTERRAA